MEQFTVKSGSASLSSMALLQKGQTIVSKLKGNEDYPTLQSLLPAFEKCCEDLEAANNLVVFNGGKIEHEAKRLAEVAMRNAIKTFGGYVQAISGGNKALILAAGYEPVKERTAPPPPAAPSDLIVSRTSVLHMLKLKWKKNKGTKVSFVEMLEEGSTQWVRILTTTRSTHTVEDLVTGKRYTFRVQVVTSTGISPMSEEVSNIAA